MAEDTPRINFRDLNETAQREMIAQNQEYIMGMLHDIAGRIDQVADKVGLKKKDGKEDIPGKH